MERKGMYLSEINYEKAKEILNENTIIVIPAGGGTKEHGSHLPLGTDMYVTQWIADKVTEKCNVLTMPIVSYAYYPAFINWEGSVSLEADTFINIMRDIIISISRFGVKKFLIIDGGVSTHGPLKILSADMRNKFGLKVAVTNILGLGHEVEQEMCEQQRGGHGDEGETSCMLHIRPDLVHMENAVEEYDKQISGTVKNGVVRVHLSTGMDTKSGINGNSKLATEEKGKKILNAMAQDVIDFIESYEKI